ncbi:hypothetical protein GFS31_35530 [Leptolyngbya sp. BL0902]|nr:hypothetical protein GFS31_35530 [Leptolyngbya sp. BL0902]
MLWLSIGPCSNRIAQAQGGAVSDRSPGLQGGLCYDGFCP